MEPQLLEWTANYIRHRDLAERKLQELKVLKNKVVAVYTDRTVTYLVAETLTSDIVAKEKGEVAVVCPNTRKNLGFLLASWKELAGQEGLRFLFVNPASPQEKWVIRPAVHEKIRDKNLAIGLKALFESVEEVRDS